MVCELHFNSKQIRVSLGIRRKTYYHQVYRRCLSLNLTRRKEKENLRSHVMIKKHLENLKLNMNPLILNALLTRQIMSLITQKTDNTTKLPADNASIKMQD